MKISSLGNHHAKVQSEGRPSLWLVLTAVYLFILWLTPYRQYLAPLGIGVILLAAGISFWRRRSQ
jgi:hypothetical protein